MRHSNSFCLMFPLSLISQEMSLRHFNSCLRLYSVIFWQIPLGLSYTSHCLVPISGPSLCHNLLVTVFHEVHYSCCHNFIVMFAIAGATPFEWVVLFCNCFSMPLYLITIFILIKNRKVEPFNNPFFKLYISAGVSDFLVNIWFYSFCVRIWGWVDWHPLFYHPTLSWWFRMLTYINWFNGVAQVNGVAVVAINRFCNIVYQISGVRIFCGLLYGLILSNVQPMLMRIVRLMRNKLSWRHAEPLKATHFINYFTCTALNRWCYFREIPHKRYISYASR